MSGTEMSPIETEMLEATGQKPRGKKEEPGDYLVRLCSAVSELADGEYEALSEPTKAWFADAAEKINEEDFDNIPSFADFEEAAKPAKGKKAAAKEEAKDDEFEPEVGSYVKVTDADDEEVEGEVTSLSAKKIEVTDADGEVHAFFLSKVTVEAAEKPAPKKAAKGKAAKEEAKDEVEVGDEGSYVKVTDADDEEVVGEVTANTGKKITVKDEEGEEHTFFLSKVEVEAAEKPEAKPAKGKKAAAKEEAKDEPEAGEVGSYVKVTDADDEEVEGEVTANTGKKITVTDADGDEHSFMLSKVEVEAADRPAPKDKAKPAAKGKAEKEDKPPKDVPKDAPKAVSGSDLVRALICENFDSKSKDDIFKLARKKGVEVSDTQLNTVYATTMRTIEILKELGRIADAE